MYEIKLTNSERLQGKAILFSIECRRQNGNRVTADLGSGYLPPQRRAILFVFNAASTVTHLKQMIELRFVEVAKSFEHSNRGRYQEIDLQVFTVYLTGCGRI